MGDIVEETARVYLWGSGFHLQIMTQLFLSSYGESHPLWTYSLLALRAAFNMPHIYQPLRMESWSKDWRWKENTMGNMRGMFKVGGILVSLGPIGWGLPLSPECVTSLCVFHPWRSEFTLGLKTASQRRNLDHRWCYCVEGRPHVPANICVKTDSLGTHNLGNISTWKVERLQEGYFNCSWGPLY